MSDDFTQPLRGDKFEAEQYEGALLLFYPTEYFSSIPTQHGETAVVDTHIVALDRPDLTGQPTVLRDARIFGRALVPQLKGAVGGKPVLGRLGKGQNTKGNAPWILKDFTEADAQAARAWATNNQDPRNESFGVGASKPNHPSPPTVNASASSATAGADFGVQMLPPTQPAVSPGAPGVPARDPQLVAQLAARGVDVSTLPPNADLKLILQSLGG